MKITVDSLRSVLRDLGLPTAGPKAVLMKRWVDAGSPHPGVLDDIVVSLADDGVNAKSIVVRHPSSPPGVLDDIPSDDTILTLAEDLELDATDLVAHADALTVNSDSDYSVAGDFLVKTIRALTAKISATFDPIIKAAHTAHKKAIAAKHEHMRLPLSAEKTIKHRMGLYVQHKRAEEEKERAKLERELQQAAEQARVDEAARLLGDNDVEGATAILEDLAGGNVEPESLPIPLVHVAPKAAGTTVRMIWDYEFIGDDTPLVQRTPINRRFMTPDRAKIYREVLRIGKGAEKTVGGIRVFQKPSVGARR